MKAFTECVGTAASLLRDNIDTDVIVRIERVAQGRRGEFGPWAFEILRYRPDGSENPDFILNQAPFRDAKVLLAGANFGCGSSREMAVWALDDFGIRCVIAESFGDIFHGNCLQIGVLPIVLPRELIEHLAAVASKGVRLKVDLRASSIEAEGIAPLAFDVAPSIREAFLTGLDEIGVTLTRAAEIERYQRHDRELRPWIHQPPGKR
ncbi:MAG TPA: 3-isopropylmalate dehydratase small subunit [Burkholderiaceae bacterium]|nr:3-isopropylmalate dehydratase small subunit [Burkholderiaceae bacterium]